MRVYKDHFRAVKFLLLARENKRQCFGAGGSAHSRCCNLGRFLVSQATARISAAMAHPCIARAETQWNDSLCLSSWNTTSELCGNSPLRGQWNLCIRVEPACCAACYIISLFVSWQYNDVYVIWATVQLTGSMNLLVAIHSSSSDIWILQLKNPVLLIVKYFNYHNQTWLRAWDIL